MKFFVGIPEPAWAFRFENSFISVNRLKRRLNKSFKVNNWIIDSGAFTEISTHGKYRNSEEEYAEQVEKWLKVGKPKAVVSQDYMCEPFILQKTGLTVVEHQEKTVERFLNLKSLLSSVYVMPVLQGFSPPSYVEHIKMYGGLLTEKAYVGVGSVCKRNQNPAEVLSVLRAIKDFRPDLRLHGFGLKITSLLNPEIRSLLKSSDSMAWSYAARREGRSPNSWIEAKNYEEKVRALING